MKKSNAFKTIINWFEKYHWRPFSFQIEVWNEYLKGSSGLIHASTGTGKTYAVFFGAVIEYLNAIDRETKSNLKSTAPFTILWITPLRALATDTTETLLKPVNDLNLNWTVEKRTGDTSSSQRIKQSKKLPTVLITTPESLSLLLSYPASHILFKTLKLVVADEWHELISSKRGVLTELSLARLKSWIRNLKIWGLSATLGNTQTAMQALLGSSFKNGKLIKGMIPKPLEIKTIKPKNVEKFPLAGHLGINLISEVIKKLDEAESSLLFTNTRSQAEIWYREILNLKPEWENKLALHHGSIDKKERKLIEDLLRLGKLKCVVCTSSLDLGVDFSPVDRVIQIGSPKGIARLLQRAGRSRHQPGKTSEIICVPTNSFELIEFAAVRSAIEKGFIEPRFPIELSLDVLSQHLITIALGGGFKSQNLFEEVKTTNAFKNLTEEEWNWVLDFITKGGPALRAYPEYQKVIKTVDLFLVEKKSIAARHRMSIGTIASDSSLMVKFIKGNNLGSIEESFISKMKPGAAFIFAGRNLEYVRTKDMTVWVKKAKQNKGLIPQWMGGRMPLSTELAFEVRNKFNEALNNQFINEEMLAIQPIFNLQKKWSVIPALNEILIEKIKTREGFHLFFYPFEGKLVHEGLASLIAFRISKIKPITFSISTNDYGFELLSSDDLNYDEIKFKSFFSLDNLLKDILESLNTTEMARRQFREIARVAGLVFQGYPGTNKTVKQIQASSGLLYDVFKKYDPNNLLIAQASSEVLKNQLEYKKLSDALMRINKNEIKLINCKYVTPLAFPIMVNRFREKLSSEKLADRVRKMQEQLEKAADKG